MFFQPFSVYLVQKAWNSSDSYVSSQRNDGTLLVEIHLKTSTLVQPFKIYLIANFVWFFMSYSLFLFLPSDSYVDSWLNAWKTIFRFFFFSLSAHKVNFGKATSESREEGSKLQFKVFSNEQSKPFFFSLSLSDFQLRNVLHRQKNIKLASRR